MLNNSIYEVARGLEFYVFFTDLQLRHEFLKSYSPRKGFGICAQEDRFRLYTNDYVFYAKVKTASQDANQIIGVSINKMDPITQRDTFDSAIKRTQVIGLDERYFGVLGEKGRQLPPLDYYEPRKFIEFVRRETKRNQGIIDSNNNVDVHAAMEKASFLAEHQKIIEEKQKYAASTLKSISYIRFSDALQNVQDGVVYKFEVLDTENAEGFFKEHTPVKVTANNRENSLSGIVVDCDEKNIYVKFQLKNSAYINIASQGNIEEVNNPEYGMKLKVIQQLRQGIENNPYLLDVVVRGQLQPFQKKVDYKVKKVTLSNGKIVDNVNASQKDAIERALSVDDFLLVQGPPGTGKTTIITEMVKMFVEQDKRILICSKNNLAVDNVLEKCQQLFYDKGKVNKMQCLRLGNEEKVIKSVKHVLPRPLTMTIQEDVKGRSVKAKEEYKKEEERRSCLYETAIQDTEIIFELLHIFEREYCCYKNILGQIENSLWRILLGRTRRTEITACIKRVIVKIEELVRSLWELLYKESIEKASIRAEEYCNCVKNMSQMINGIEGQLLEAKMRYTLIFKGNKGEVWSSVTNFPMQCPRIIEKIKALEEYRGNGAANRMRKYETCLNKYMGRLFEFRQEMKDVVEECKKRLFLWEKVLEEWHEELKKEQNSFEDSLLKSVKIIGATCIGVNTNAGFKDTIYDVAIVDEAGQINLHDLLVPIVKAKKVILIGDHLQLPPSQEREFCQYLKDNKLLDFAELDTKNDNDEYMKEMQDVFSVSLFEKLFRDERLNANKVMLDTQFRMHPDIAEFISENFYGGKYKSGVSPEERYLKIADFNKPLYFIDTCNSQKRYEDINEDESKHSNSYEAKICGKYIARILWAIETNEYEMAEKSLRDESGNYDIGVITAYSAQIELIRKEILKNLKQYCGVEQAENMVSHLAINTLDSFQGRDNQIIFYSFVRSNKERSIGFLNEVRRLNVMMTRAKSLLVMVGDSKTLTENRQITVHDEIPSREYFVKLVQYCKEKSGYVDAAREVDCVEETKARD